MTSLDIPAPIRSAGGSGGSIRGSVLAALDGFSAMTIAVMDWQIRARERRRLLGLSDRALQDFGASRADAEHEGGKPFWQR
jgi:uncharacterized protein YjiS (DUF1127 family)